MRRSSQFSLTPWVRGLIIANVVVYFLQITVFTGPWFGATFAFTPDRVAQQWWTFGTYLFLHDGFFHLALNLWFLYLFGRAVEEEMGSWFGLYYFFCGLGGAALSFALAAFAPTGPIVGASGAVLGVALAFALRWPDAEILLFPIPVPIKAKWLVIFFAALDLLPAVFRINDGIAHFAHLGGLLFGFLYIKGEDAVVRRARLAMRRAAERRPKRPRRRSLPAAPERPVSHRRPRTVESELDRVLDKISASGLDSLTPEERRVLDEASRQLREH